MENSRFRIKYNGKEIEFEVESGNLQLWKADKFDEKIGLFINIQAEGVEIDLFNEQEQKAYKHYLKPRIYTEWLDIPIDYIKNKNFRTLEEVSIDFLDSDEMDDVESLIWTEAPGALYVDNHRVFEKVKIDFKYEGNGTFTVHLKGTAEFETPFEVSMVIPLEIELIAYRKRATKENILNFFHELFNPEEFNQNWRYRDDDIFFKAIPKESENVC